MTLLDLPILFVVQRRVIADVEPAGGHFSTSGGDGM
jgi:hypothetical protein